MILVEIRKEAYRSVREPVLYQKYWYDPFYKKGHMFNCSKLSYKYVDEYYLEKEFNERVPLVEASKDDLIKFSPKKDKRVVAVPEIYEYSINKTINISKEIYAFIHDFFNYHDTSMEVIEDNKEKIVLSFSYKNKEKYNKDKDKEEQDANLFVSEAHSRNMIYRVINSDTDKSEPTHDKSRNSRQSEFLGKGTNV